jgi:hypothetical protein
MQQHSYIMHRFPTVLSFYDCLTKNNVGLECDLQEIQADHDTADQNS